MGEHKVRLKDVLRSKNFLILVLFIVATSISIWLLNLPTPNLRSIMSETHKQIESQIKNFKNMKQDMMMNEQNEDRELTLDQTYLELLGFNNHPRLYPLSEELSPSLPVIVSGTTKKNLRNTIRLIGSVQKYLQDKQMVIFDLGMGSYELVTLKKHCNETSNCSVRSLDFDKFPRHLRDMGMKAYLPVAIQDVLNQFGAIIWATSDHESYFVSSDLSGILNRANVTSFVAWTIESMDSTSALTHPKMFEYFETKQEDFYFHRMVSTDHLVIFNSQTIHYELMQPWVECALTKSCIFPRGAQSVGCDHNRKPKYKYSGCHNFEVSALNVILGSLFGDGNSQYISQAEVFGVEPEVVTPLYSNVTTRGSKSSMLENRGTSGGA